jgi:hypothetical protein
MTIFLEKFGTTLISRQAGREALAAFRPSLKELATGEGIEIDFKGVITFSPSWGDEFLRPLYREYQNEISLKNTKNPSVKATLKTLEKIGNIKLR